MPSLSFIIGGMRYVGERNQIPVFFGMAFGQVALYALSGILTTAVNVAAYWACADMVGMPTVPSTAVAWVAAVLFAYLTNRVWVFGSTKQGAECAGELFSFFAGRAATGVVELGLMALLVDFLGFSGPLSKLATCIVAAVLNFVFARVFVFKEE